jgi:formylglycine-generating enzyme required for sulfatase activity
MKEKEKTLGDYILLKTLGHGALGTVYLAEHKFLKKPFALKILPEELASDRGFVQRFEKEVHLLSALDHPNVVKIHNASFIDGQYFVVTDCIVDRFGETTNLAQYVTSHKEPLQEEEIVEIVRQIASALSWVHDKEAEECSFAHCGLKLSNVLIGYEDGKQKVYLSDFGLTRVIGQGPLLSRTYKALCDLLGAHSGIVTTKTGIDKYAPGILDLAKTARLHQSFLQTFAFLAPEQRVLGEEKASEIRSDIYAFGVLAYYLLTREFPEGIFDLPSDVRQDLKKNWNAFIIASLKKDPLKRPSSITELLGLLDSAGSYHPNQLHFEGFDDQTLGLKPVIKPQEITRPEYEPNPGAIFQMEKVVEKYLPKEQETKNIEPLLTEMVVVSGGQYHRGSSKGARDEMPRHMVMLSPFAIDIHPTTNEQFVRFLQAMGGEKDVNNNDIIRLKESRIKRTAGRLTIESGYAKHPVVGVTWYGAVAYAKWVGKRLPTEAEWEVAAMGGQEEALYPSGEDIERTQANFFSSDTTAVMSYRANGYNLFDMAGNVYEWCQDWYGYNYYELSIQQPENPKGPLQGVYRVLRGGCWKSLKEDMRVTHRHRNNPGTVNGTYGFRCATDVS